MTERAVLPPLGWIAPARRLRVLVWHVHAAWLSAFVSGRHEYLIPRDASGGGKCGRNWPNAVEITEPSEVDVVVLQRPEDVEAARQWVLGRPPMVYVEHNTPKGQPHPLADRDDVGFRPRAGDGDRARHAGSRAAPHRGTAPSRGRDQRTGSPGPHRRDPGPCGRAGQTVQRSGAGQIRVGALPTGLGLAADRDRGKWPRWARSTAAG